MKLIFLSSDAATPPQTLFIDGHSGHDVSSVARSAKEDAREPYTILVIPGTDVLARWMELPAATAAQALAAARLSLAEFAAAPVETLHIAVAPGSERGHRLFYALDRARMRSFLERAAALGVVPACVIPDHALLAAPAGGSMLAVPWDGRYLLRSEHLAASIERDIAELVTAGKDVISLTDAAAIEAMFAATARNIACDLLQQEFAPAAMQPSPWTGWRRVAALAAAVLVSPLLVWGAGAARSTAAAWQMESRAATLAGTLAPEAADPLASISERIDAAAANRQLLRSAAALFQVIAELENAELERMAWLGEQNVLSATLRHREASDIAALSQSLANSGLALSEDASAEANGLLSTTIALRPLP
jgi:general secretion pathway protein L